VRPVTTFFPQAIWTCLRRIAIFTIFWIVSFLILSTGSSLSKLIISAPRSFVFIQSSRPMIDANTLAAPRKNELITAK
jgi:hypothetical protein